jgi:hypothetical protein
MKRKVLAIVFVAVLLSVAPFLASGCGTGKAVAQPSLSPMEQPRLVNLGDFALLGDRPTRIWVHLEQTQPLRIVVISERRVKSCSLSRVAGADGSLVTPVPVALEGGRPHGNSGTEVISWFGSPSLDPGYYRIELTGRGRIMSLIVDRRRG